MNFLPIVVKIDGHKNEQQGEETDGGITFFFYKYPLSNLTMKICKFYNCFIIQFHSINLQIGCLLV